VFEPPVVAQVADELQELGAALRTDAVSARGVALPRERLVSRATSPLYGHDVAALNEELCRVRRLLSSANRGGGGSCAHREVD
jgi:hypothetical protein